jgi:DNA-binding beta-propeller fold protein YncE
MTRRFATLAFLATLVPAAIPAQTFSVAKYNIGGDGGTDYVTAEPGTRRVFVSRGTHVMVVDGATGKVVADIPDTPRMHGVGIAAKWKHGFTTNAGDSTVTMFDLATLAPIRKIPVKVGGLDGIMYDDYSDRIILTNHSRPIGTAVALDANTATSSAPRSSRTTRRKAPRATGRESCTSTTRARTRSRCSTRSR